MAVIRDRHFWVRSDAFLEVVALLPGRWRVAKLLRIFPRWLRDWLMTGLRRIAIGSSANTTSVFCLPLIMNSAF